MTAADREAANLNRRLARERQARLEAEGIAERITRELYEAVQKLTRSSAIAELLGAVAVAANEAASAEAAMRVALDEVCRHTGWPVGHALAVTSTDPREVVSMNLWHLDDPERYQDFRTETEAIRFAVGIGLPGRVLATGGPAWITSVSDDPNFPRRAQARAAGLGAAFAFPVLARYDVRAVVEFFSTEVLHVDGELLRAMGQVGTQLGRVFEREEAEAQLVHQALYDSLTGLPNRVLLMERVERALATRARYSTGVDLLFVDVDEFKTINDSLGHAAGDAVLRAVGTRLASSLRAVDTVARSTSPTVARLGGDEFAIILLDCADPRLVAERLSAAVRAPLIVEGQEVFVTLSIGGARAASTSATSELVRAADLAMHVAKRNGKDRFELYHPSMQEAADRRLVLGSELRRAIEGGQLRLHYQPVVSLVDGTVLGVEALVRWEHPVWGLVPPMEFIPLAEETGLIIPLGRWVLEEACREAAGWDSDPALESLTIAVNLSGRQLRDPELCQLVRNVLDETQLGADRLVLEVTESVLIDEDDNDAIATLGALRDLGITLAVDDFGTGYSSLGALKRLPIHVLKVDRSFVSGLPDDEDAGTIVWAVIRLGHNLKLTVLAEGVETPSQLAALRAYGCDQAQGYLFSRPVPADQLQHAVARYPVVSRSGEMPSGK